ncbi:ROK family protein [Rhizobium grahamii]|uniref:ROK family protein n=1 Tax=Rhizobium grahamii CCGE 502 TaxID=990285 RepID=S3I5T4_9HYPH|nr:ROK family protein [Rhizobium grahamii]EPE94878.1 ROK family protein [Rhizobium grahamii CCGE 502]
MNSDNESIERRILAVDIGGNNLKILSPGVEERKTKSGPTLSARQAVDAIILMAKDIEYDVISIGYPGPVHNNTPSREPANLGPGWQGFDFVEAFGKPLKLLNDALMQAIGSYKGGRLLFLGLGTGLGSAMVIENVAQPLELAHLPYKKLQTFEDYVGKRGLVRRGHMKWKASVFDVVARFQAALLPDYTVIGGGQIDELDELPNGCLRGDNRLAFQGGFRIWQDSSIIL